MRKKIKHMKINQSYISKRKDIFVNSLFLNGFGQLISVNGSSSSLSPTSVFVHEDHFRYQILNKDQQTRNPSSSVF